MHRTALALLTAALGGCVALGLEERRPVPPPPPPPRTVWVVGLDGRAIGQATFMEGVDGVLIRLEISAGALSAGWHGVHIHQTGDCTDAAENFEAAGGHAPGEPRQHGVLNLASPEAGDLPNLFASTTGPIGGEFYSQRLTLHRRSAEGRMPLLDADGSALIVHAGADDHVIQPAGGAGGRVACAALRDRN